MSIMSEHKKDSDCTVDPATDCCVECGVYHGDPCSCCGEIAFHLPECPRSDACRCGSGKFKYALTDARGIFCDYVCEDCEAEVRKRYRSDIFRDPAYYADEPIEEEY